MSNETKKTAESKAAKLPNDNYISLKEFCKDLSISTATGCNWIKLGKLTPEYVENDVPYFTTDYAMTVKSEIESGKNKSLKSRRNKKYISGHALYRSYVSENSNHISVLQKLLDIIASDHISLTIDIIQYIIADCALHLFAQKKQLTYKEEPLLYKYLNNEMKPIEYEPLIDALITDRSSALSFCHTHPSLFHLDYCYEANEDILGLIYISCKNISNRKASGSYYTPVDIVKKIISKLDINTTTKILDPCCGTGSFLLQLPKTACFDHIYGTDIDAVSIKITRLNMALKYPAAGIDKICQHITNLNYLTEYSNDGFDYIIGNPPWGYDFTDDEKKQLQKKYKTASKKYTESYDMFIERALSNLVKGGQLAYVLPEAVLNVKAHTDTRELILKKNSIKYLEFLGNAFDRVQCPCIILMMTRTDCPLSTVGMSVNNKKQLFTIKIKRSISSEHFNFITTDDEYLVLEKLKKCEGISSLRGNADFALGIVTGNNKKYISSQKNAENEMILKGSDLSKYHTNQADTYINFQPELFQQTAPISMYRAPEKLLYRFICNQLVFAYDDKQTLSLNSCNIVIPKLANTKLKYILAILNSGIAQFIFNKEFHSVKVLRSHIENIPIPIVNEHLQNNIITITDLLIQGQAIEQATELYKELDNMIFDIFHLTEAERTIIKLAVDTENKFL